MKASKSFRKVEDNQRLFKTPGIESVYLRLPVFISINSFLSREPTNHIKVNLFFKLNSDKFNHKWGFAIIRLGALSRVTRNLKTMWKLLTILCCVAITQGCRVIEQKANGVEQTRDAHSSHVLLETFLSYEAKYLCSGVLISADYVLTTALCVFGAMFVNVHVYPHKLRDVFEANREIYRSTEVMMAPSFNGLTHSNDVALVKLPSTLNIAARPYSIAQLPTEALVDGIQGTAVGWGLLNFKDDNAAAIKQEQTMIKITDTYCRLQYPEIWTGEEMEGRACVLRSSGQNCVSDSGSPFMIGDVVHGLLSFGQSDACELDSFPNGIQTIFTHLTWIRSIVSV